MKIASRLKSSHFKLSKSDKALINYFAHSFRGDFLRGARFQAIKNLSDLVLPQNSFLQDPVVFAHRCVMTGLGFSLYPLVDSVGQVIVKPDLQSYRKFVPWTFSTALVSSAVTNAVSLIGSCMIEGKSAFTGWHQRLLPSAASTGGFQLGMRLAHDILPQPCKMGGVFAHSTAVMAMGDLVGSVCRAPFEKKSPRDVITEFVRGLPGLIFDQAMLTGMAYRSRMPKP